MRKKDKLESLGVKFRPESITQLMVVMPSVDYVLNKDSNKYKNNMIDAILNNLNMTNNISKTAKIMNIPLRSLYRKIGNNLVKIDGVWRIK